MVRPAPSSQQDKVTLRKKCSSVNVDKEFIDDIVCMHLLTERRYHNPFLSVLATKDYQVYVLGQDVSDDFGMKTVTVTANSTNLTKIDTLCGLKIYQFASGNDHILALSEYGEVYAWGYNDFGQLGNNSMTRSSVPVVVAGDLENQVVKQIECCSGSSVALSENGKVFTWGENSFGRTGLGTVVDSSLSPKVVEGLLIDQKIIKISTNWLSVFCLSAEGKVFGFGYNAYGNLGYDRSEDCQPSPIQVRIPDRHKIKDISSGSSHTLALTDDGDLFVWGRAENRGLPVQIKLCHDGHQTSYPKVIRILAERSDLSFAMDDDGSVYAWGGRSSFPPIKYEIPFPEPFNKVSRLPASKGVISDLLKSFDNAATSDFVIAVEGRNIHVHKTILRMRSSYFDINVRQPS